MGVGLCLSALALAPEILRQFAGYFWNVPGVDEAALGMVRALLPLVGIEAEIQYELRRIIVGDFAVRVNQSCSGIEGALLVSGFMTGITVMLRRELDPRRMAILILTGALLSWCLNAMRITALIWLGVHVSPELAIDGFHSNAGWLLFVLLSMTLLWIAANLRWFQRKQHVSPPVTRSSAETPSGILQDPVAARILPFVLFLAPVLVLPTVTLTPDQAYPLRAAIGLLALLAFWPALRQLPLRLSSVAIACGLLIGLAWIAAHILSEGEHGTAGNHDPEPYWIAARLLGTILIAPIVEELFFRSYLIQRLGSASRQHLILNICASTAIFAALHSNWLMAGIAGLIFTGLMLRHGRITDAIQAHVSANALIGGFALWTGDWSAI